MAIIYKATNKTNNKVYIGKTNKNLQERIKEHKDLTIRYKHKFAYALKKYGIDGFEWIVVESNILENKINEKECYYINFFNSYENGYNSTIGGEGNNGLRSQETKNKISQFHKGKILTSEHKNKIRESLKGNIPWNKGKKWSNKKLIQTIKGSNNPMYGKKHSEETKEKIRQKAVGRKLTEESKKRISLTLKSYYEK